MMDAVPARDGMRPKAAFGEGGAVIGGTKFTVTEEPIPGRETVERRARVRQPGQPVFEPVHGRRQRRRCGRAAGSN